jgi:thiamine-monophosphate kinase
VLAGGDDCALVAPRAGRELAITTDMLAEGTHFLPGADPEALGHKTLAVNLSDLAAMGAEPRWAFLALALPDAEESWVAAFARGFLSLARQFDVDLAGGDTTRGPRNLCVTAIGEVVPGRAMRRSAARLGDDIYLSGCTGEAAFGLVTCQQEVEAEKVDIARCRLRLDRPMPRVALGRTLAGVAHAAIDVSDGLVADLAHLCEESGLGAVVQWSRVPQSSALSTCCAEDRRRFVLSGGDDYELVFTAPVAARREISARAAAAATPVTRIGTMVAGERVTVLDAAGDEMTLTQAGYDHFR